MKKLSSTKIYIYQFNIDVPGGDGGEQQVEYPEQWDTIDMDGSIIVTVPSEP